MSRPCRANSLASQARGTIYIIPCDNRAVTGAVNSIFYGQVSPLEVQKEMLSRGNPLYMLTKRRCKGCEGLWPLARQFAVGVPSHASIKRLSMKSSSSSSSKESKGLLLEEPQTKNTGMVVGN